MLVPRLVVFGAARRISRLASSSRVSVVQLPGRDLLDQVQQRAAVAIGHLQHRLARLALQRQGAAQFLLGPLRQPLQIGQDSRSSTMTCARLTEGGVQLELRVFGGGADQKDGAILHMRQEAVLLGLVEAVDLVDEQQRALPVLAPDLRRSNTLRRSGTPVKIALIWTKGQVGLHRPAAARWWSCPPPAAPRGSATTAERRQHRAQRAFGRQHLVPARSPRQARRCRRGRSRSASGRGRLGLMDGLGRHPKFAVARWMQPRRRTVNRASHQRSCPLFPCPGKGGVLPAGRPLSNPTCTTPSAVWSPTRSTRRPTSSPRCPSPAPRERNPAPPAAPAAGCARG
jgi:hypothetical protein